MKLKRFLHFAILLIATVLSASSQEFTYIYEGSELNYQVINDECCSVGGGTDKSYTNVIIPEEVVIEGKKYRVTEIRDNGFYGFSNLTSVVIPPTVTSIGAEAFCSCEAMTELVIPNSVTNISRGAFKVCKGLTSLELPNSVTTLENEVFSDCYGLKKLTLPSNIKTINTRLCWGCISLESIDIPIGVTKICGEAFKHCRSMTSVNIPNTVERIEGEAFREFAGSSIFIPASVKFIANGVFKESRLNNIEVAEANTEYLDIDGVLFDRNNTLIQFPTGRTGTYTIPDGTVAVADGAFWASVNITGVSIPNTVQYIGGEAFYCCFKLNSIKLPNSLKVINDRTFGYCDALSEIIFPSSLTDIRQGAFMRCPLTSVRLPEGLTNIHSHAFHLCSLVSIDITDSVTFIGDGAFGACTSLQTVNLGKATAAVGGNQFDGCPSLMAYSAHPENTAYTAVDGILYNKEITKLVAYPPVARSQFVIPRCVDTIPENVIRALNSVSEISVEEGNNSFSAVDGVLFNIDKSSLLRFPGGKAGSYTVPESVKQIGQEAFYSSVNLESVIFPENSKADIAWNAFQGCKKLKNVYIPNTVTLNCGSFADSDSLRTFRIPSIMTFVPNDLFARCYALTSVEIPESITSINNNAFHECFSLREIKCAAKTPPTFGDASGVNFEECKVIVPVGTVESYRNADGWKSFKNIVDESSFINWSIHDMSVRQGKRITLAVAMKNPTPVISFQCDIHLPAGFTVVKDADDYIDLNLTARGADTHIIDGNQLADGRVRVLAYSDYNLKFNESDGVLFTLNLEATSAEVGLHEISIDNIVCVNEQLQPMDISATKCKVEVRPLLVKGDVNGDEVISVTDASFTVAHILGNTPEGFLPELADLNGDNAINIADVNQIINIVHTAKPSQHSRMNAAPARMLISEASAENGNLFVKDFNLKAGEILDMPVYLMAPRNYSAFQTDIYLPEGVEVVDSVVGSILIPNVRLAPGVKTKSHSTKATVQPDGALRITSYSTRLSMFGTSANNVFLLVRVRAKSDYESTPQDVFFKNTTFNAGTEEYKFIDTASTINEGVSTGVDGIEAEMPCEYYNLQGIRINTPQRGSMYICKRGSEVTKVIF